MIPLFIANKEEYVTKPEFEALLPPVKWWKEPKLPFKPPPRETLKAMNFETHLMWRVLMRRNLILSGRAGAGKSRLIRQFHRTCPKHIRLGITGFTGMAVSSLQIKSATTLHSRLCLGTMNKSLTEYLELLGQGKLNRTKRSILETDILLVDEATMITMSILKIFDRLCQVVRRQKGVPFGGMRLIFCGDFRQLGPVDPKKKIGEDLNYIFEASVVSKMNAFARIFLYRSYRQEPGPYLDMLDELGAGRLSVQSIEMLESRVKPNPLESMELDGKSLVPVTVMPTLEQVNNFNFEALSRLSSDPFTFTPMMHVQVTGKATSKVRKAAQRAVDEVSPTLVSRFPLYQVNLKIGCQVMMRSNLYKRHGVVNGTIGLVRAVGPHAVAVEFKLEGGQKALVQVERTEMSVTFGRHVQIVIHQFPLTLAYAITTHKMQGQTVDQIHASISGNFASGQGYVALTRTRKLEDLTLDSFDPSDIFADPRVVDFEVTQVDNLLASVLGDRAKMWVNKRPREEEDTLQKAKKQKC